MQLHTYLDRGDTRTSIYINAHAFPIYIYICMTTFIIHKWMHHLIFHTARRSVLEMVDEAQEELGGRMVATTQLMMRTAAPLINTLVTTRSCSANTEP
jgi:hypothetical protein